MHEAVKGAKGGSKKPRQPNIANDTVASKTYVKIQCGMGEGEVEGLANGHKSIYLDDTPVENDAGEKNFQNLKVDFRSGTNDQTYMEGFEDISSETAVGVELKSATPWVKGITNLNLDAVMLRIRFGALKQQDPSNGDVSGLTIKYAIEVQTDGGPWELVLDTQMEGKTSANYERTHEVRLAKANKNWLIRVTRKTPNSTSEYVSDKMYVQAITEIIDMKLAYPNTALLGLQYDAETFSNIAKLAVEMKGIKIKVPSNYDPVSRTYNGIWNGLFKRAYINNPAWIYYDLCTAKRYALGNRLTEPMIDKWSLYRLAQYCDQKVPDGKGGEEPRFTCNVYIQSAEAAFDILNKLAGLFRAISYWDGTAIVCEADLPQDTYFTYTRANVIDGVFEYSGTRARDRHTAVKVAWDNPQNRYKTEYVFVRDEQAIAKHGLKMLDLEAWGCTSEGQAQRTGQWALKSEQLETRSVTFKVGLDGHIPLPGKVIEVADELFAGRANGGRIAAVSKDRKSITLDRDDVVCRAGDRLVVNGEDGKAQARVVSGIAGRIVTVVAAFDSVAAQNVWVVDAKDLATMRFRVIAVAQNEQHQFTITALEHNPAKYDAIDHGAFIDDRPISIIQPTTQTAVESVMISSEQMVQQGLSVETMVISWSQAKDATKYQVEWRKDNGTWLKLPLTGSNSAEVAGIYAGKYEARVIAISAFDISSLPTYSKLTELKGKQGKPPKLAFIRATGVLFGMKIDWGFPATGALDTAFVEINVSPDGKSNIAQLGLFAYPTTTHTIQGLQPNLKQFYQGRLVDRIGNKGDWSAWVSGTTTANAKDVLDLLHEQISESQLNKDLQTKIEHIDQIDAQIPTLKKDIQDTKDQISQETKDRQKAIKDTEDGLTKKIIDGDNGVLSIVETNKQSTDQGFAAVDTQLKTIVSDQKLIAEKTDGVYAQLNPELAGSTVDMAGNGQIFVGTWSLQSAMIEGDLALSKRVDTTVAEVNDVRAYAQQETIARIEGDKATVQKIDTYIAENDAALATVRDSTKLAVDTSSANAERINSINLELKDKASTGALSKVESDLKQTDDKVVAQTNRIDGVYAQVNPELAGSIDHNAGSTASLVGVWSEQSARIEGDMAQAKRTEQVSAEMQQNNAVLKFEIEATATTANAAIKSTETLQTTVGENTASIQEQKQSIDGVYAQQYMKFDVNGHIVGHGSMNDGKTGTMIFNYDAVHFGAPVGVDGVQPKPLMSLQTTAVTLPNGTILPAGLYLDDAVIGKITADKIDAQSLSAITATIGKFRTSASGERVEIEDSGIYCFVDDELPIVEVGKFK
jgi:predicted phage tail protein